MILWDISLKITFLIWELMGMWLPFITTTHTFVTRMDTPKQGWTPYDFYTTEILFDRVVLDVSLTIMSCVQLQVVQVLYHLVA